MIIKVMRDDGPTKANGPKMERWEYFDNVAHIFKDIVSDPKSSGELKDNYSLSFYKDKELVTLNVMDYKKLFIMNDNGKTVETLRNV